MKVSVKEYAEKVRCTPASVYKQIEEERGIGEYFEYSKGRGGYFITPGTIWRFMGMRFKDRTDYPNIFDCYWGNFTPQVAMINKTQIERIINNRNEFVKDFNITSKSRRDVASKALGSLNCLDHVESYNVKGSRNALVISSPYGSHTLDEINNHFELPELYAPEVKTFGFWKFDNEHLFTRKG